MELDVWSGRAVYDDGTANLLCLWAQFDLHDIPPWLAGVRFRLALKIGHCLESLRAAVEDMQLSWGRFFSCSLSLHLKNWHSVDDEAEPTFLSLTSHALVYTNIHTVTHWYQHQNVTFPPIRDDVQKQTLRDDANVQQLWRHKEKFRATDELNFANGWKRKVCNTARIKEKITMHQHNSLWASTQPQDHNSSLVRMKNFCFFSFFSSSRSGNKINRKLAQMKSLKVSFYSWNQPPSLCGPKVRFQGVNFPMNELSDHHVVSWVKWASERVFLFFLSGTWNSFSIAHSTMYPK